MLGAVTARKEPPRAVGPFGSRGVSGGAGRTPHRVRARSPRTVYNVPNDGAVEVGISLP